MKYRAFFLLIAALILTLACSISGNSSDVDVDATVAAAVAQTAAANPTDAPIPPTPTPQPTNTPTPNVDATVAAAIAATSSAAATPTESAKPTPANTPESVAEEVSFFTYSDPTGYFEVDGPKSWTMDTNDSVVYFYNSSETAATLAMAVSNDEIGITNSEDQENYATGFLEGFFEDLDATAVNIADEKLVQDNLVALKFTTVGGDTVYQGAALFTLQDNILYHQIFFAEANLFDDNAKLTDPEIKAVFDRSLDSFNITYQPPKSEAAAPTPTPTSTTAAASQPAAPRTYKLAFSRWDGGKHDLYIANTNGGGEKFIFERAAGPSWSDDGQHLSFYGEEGVDRQYRGGVEYNVAGATNGILWIKVANFPDDITQVETDQFAREGTGRWTDWAPNGDMIAFDATRGGPDRRIYFLGTADNQQFHIEIPGEQGSWAPDSNQIVYRSGRDGKQGIWISNRDDSGARPITSDGSDSFPAWSPNGRKIAFHREVGGNVDIYVMNTDGSSVQRLTDAPGPDTLPAWTPDGRIIFRSARSDSWEIYIMNGNGGGQRQIIANADPGPDWSFGKMDVY
ncbi:MAG TPA: hypothetical protein G4N96_12485 [Chloroflexi bacterium]|nr:hypothetical protein [Chloroflexota bacterium]